MKVLLTSFSVFLIFLNLHTGIAVASGKTLLVPFVLCFVGTVIILFLNVKLIKSRFVGLFAVLIVVLAALAGITSLRDGNWSQHAISTGLLLYSLVIAYGTFLGLQVMGTRRASRFFLIAAMILIAGSFLEVYGGLKPASDAFREIVSSWHSEVVYNNDLRDIQDYGGIRPKFFSWEPSALGRSVGYAILFWFLSARRYTAWRALGAVVLTVPAFFLVRSPTILVCFVVLVVLSLAELGRKRGTNSPRAGLLGIAALAAMLIAPGVVASNTNYGKSASFFKREVGPPLVAAAVLSSQPFFGTGIGGWAQLIPYGKGVFSKASGHAGAELTHDVLDDPSGGKQFAGSQAWEFWIDLGLLGGALVLWILWRGFGELKVPHRFLIFSCAALFLSMSGGLVTPTGWTGLFSLACLYQMHTAALLEEDAPAPEGYPPPGVAGLPLWTN